MPPVVGLRSRQGDLAVLYFAAGSRAKVRPDALKGDLDGKWFDPRTGQWSAATRDEEGQFVAPDEQDWTLLLAAK